MPTPPDIAITRRPTGEVTAEGGDELAATLLKRAGFVIETTPRSFWHRLPWDMGEARENQMASHAARMLAAVGYRVGLGPDLHIGLLATPSDPQGGRVHGHQILRLTDELNGAETYETAADLADHVLDPHDGVLVRLSEFFEAAAEQAKASESDAGWDLSYDFAEAAATLTDVGEDLRVAAEQLRELHRPAKPSWQARVTDYFAAVPSTKRAGASTTPTTTSATTPPSAPKPKRTR
ncbi:hypothetical protein ACFUJR_36490 [Streptomyces sp. NPDC057271]|uniref:hypothetical protein n=1 Tax=unclassified Streptomyces TaxID=2593676 RepID=UPI003643C9E7